MKETALIGFIAFIIVLVNIPRFSKKEKAPQYLAISGNFKGQTHVIKDWRKIALELAKTVKNNELSTKLKYATDDDLTGLLYINFGVDLVKV